MFIDVYLKKHEYIMDPLFRQIGPVIALKWPQAIEVFGGPDKVVIVMDSVFRTKYPGEMGVTYEVGGVFPVTRWGGNLLGAAISWRRWWAACTCTTSCFTF